MLDHRGPLTGDEFLDILLQHPATPQRLAWRICQTFMGEAVVDEPALAELAEGLHAHGLDVGWAVETVLRSKLFFSQQNLRSRVAGPVELVVGTLRALELTDPPPSTLLLAEWVARMGQDLFYPPNVGGWSEGQAWLSSRSIVARANFAVAMTAGELWSPTHRRRWKSCPVGTSKLPISTRRSPGWPACCGARHPRPWWPKWSRPPKMPAGATGLVGRGAAVGQARISIVLTHSSLGRIACSPDAGF